MLHIRTPQPQARLGIKYLAPDACLSEACPICSARSITYLSIPSIGTGRPLTYFKCTMCATTFLPEQERNENYYHQSVNAIDEPKSTPSFLKHYLEIGAGPDFMTQVISKALKFETKSFCSVGCGAGIDLDIVKALTNGEVEVIGFEPNSYGPIEDISVKIINEALTDQWLNKNSQRFDIIFASEVIEHIPDPISFCRTMLNALSEGNAELILTTPNANLISPEFNAGDVYAALFPGEHKIIFTKKSLERTLKSAGFASVHVTESDLRLTATARKTKKDTKVFIASPRQPDPYIKYLRKFISTSNPDSKSPLIAGNSFRLLSELINNGKESEALAFLNQSQVLLDLCQIENSIPTLKKSELQKALEKNNFDARIQSSRGFLGPFSYYLGMLALRLEKPEVAANEFKKALQILSSDESLSPFNFQVSCSLIDPCKKELLISLIKSNQHSEAATLLKTYPNLTSTPEIRNLIIRSFTNISNGGNFEIAKLYQQTIDQHNLAPLSKGDHEDIKKAKGQWAKTIYTDSLLFDYHITRSYFEINVSSDQKTAKQHMRAASNNLKNAPSLTRLRILVKLAWLLRQSFRKQ